MTVRGRRATALGWLLIVLAAVVWIADSWIAFAEHRAAGGGMAFGFVMTVFGILVIHTAHQKEEQ